MAYKLVTCPESGHLELIEVHDHSLGLLISDCSRWRDCGGTCARTCAARLDRRMRGFEHGDLEVGDTTAVDVLCPT